MFADEELERLRGFPEIGRDELFRVFTLTSADVVFVDPGRGRGPADRLGPAVALSTLPWLGFVPDKVSAAPPVAVARMADQLAVDPAELRSYGWRQAPRRQRRPAAVSGAVSGSGPGPGSWSRAGGRTQGPGPDHPSPGGLPPLEVMVWISGWSPRQTLVFKSVCRRTS
ncbi:DUF4158 domain-containing protein [Streptosporangium sp. NPDC003464]